MNIKPILTAIIATTSVMLATPSIASDTCVHQKFVSRISAGYVKDGPKKGPDSGNAVFVHFSDYTKIALNKTYNLNEPKGRELYSTLKMAMVAGLRVTVKDHFGTRCDDFDEVTIFSN